MRSGCWHRCSVVVDAGRVVADGRTADLRADADLLAAHRLVLPYGFDPPHVGSPSR